MQSDGERERRRRAFERISLDVAADALIKIARQSNHELSTQRQSFQNQLAAQETEISDLRRDLSEQKQYFQNQLAAQEAEHKDKFDVIRKKHEIELASIKNSLSWRATSPMRKIWELILQAFGNRP